MYKDISKRIVAALLLVATAAGCSGKGDQVAMWVAAGAVLTATQMLHEERREIKGQTKPVCVTFCTRNEVPCGNSCWPHGTLCYMPAGTACYGGSPDAENADKPFTTTPPNNGRSMTVPLIIGG